MQKSRIIATFIVLFAFIFAYLHATPLHLDPHRGDMYVVILEKLDGKIEFTELSTAFFMPVGVFNKGITENAPEHYFIQFSKSNFIQNFSFAELAIPIHPPKAGPLGPLVAIQVHLDKLIDSEVSILKDDEVLDSAKVVKESP
ncbi:hypothetical protein C2G38_2033221 [Gigaspora rosea]|uniref:Uncharacterized protein n=1 Tax=Gigaspora rosea TaxID=44941 RepID=A0A397VLZ8_9GLOM|nr:hypothetical protein C2G38_2033221 [Gigaspora rosea]